PAAADERPTAKRLAAERVTLADLGGEHLAHAVYRQARRGGSIAAWGERVLVWPLEGKSPMREAAPRDSKLRYSNGGCALDIDGDGDDEIVVARGRSRSGVDPELVWLDETSPSAPWVIHPVAKLGAGPISPHDIVPFTAPLPDGGQARGVALVLDRRVLAWFEIGDDPKQPWTRREIAELPLSGQSGIAAGDVSGTGRTDLICGTFWAECPADPRNGRWRVRRYGRWNDGGWGGMNKLALADMDGDGRLDIVASEAEIPDARLGVFSRDPSRPDAPWNCREIEKGLYCPHSLVATDLDGDGKTDLVVGEMTAGGWSFPLQERPRILAYLNRGERPFERQQLDEGRGVHEMGLAPNLPGGGCRVFAADEIQPQKFPQMKTHVTLWTIERAR
ncbi:MAG TPA: VCBS repeat-containing protein, partial [Thermomicrobiales bacterium]|nr:VCBS repeat-containing protein [Thermomicrobiales bacterium]